MEAAEVIGNIDRHHTILWNDFLLSEEVQESVKNMLSYLNVIKRELAKYFNKDKFFQVYSKIILRLLQIEKGFLDQDKKDKKALIRSMNEFRWVFVKYGKFVPSEEYITYFATLASYYFDIDNCDRAIWCHERILEKDEKASRIQYFDEEAGDIRIPSPHDMASVSVETKCYYHRQYSGSYRFHKLLQDIALISYNKNS